LKDVTGLRVEPGHAAGLAARDPGSRLDLVDKVVGAAELAVLTEEISGLQNRLWAEEQRALLVVLQGMDAAGKDGTIRRVFSGVNPQGCRVTSFKAPSHAELAHDYLWRVHANCPRRGEIGIWNRSHYEDVVTVSVGGLITKAQRKRRIRHVRDFEAMLTDEGTEIVKIFLHISRDEQRERLQARLDDPEKRWKFNLADLDARKQWDEYQLAYEKALTETSTEWAPWHVVPGDHKWVRDVAVARLLSATLRRMDPQFPPAAPGLDGLSLD
jgi:PPK2 family polyphosphate:nucleotide phosphotransferase